MHFLSLLVTALPLASATFFLPKDYCATVTSTCFVPTKVPGTVTATTNCAKTDWLCCSTTTKARPDCATAWTTKYTQTITVNPTKTITNPVTKTSTCIEFGLRPKCTPLWKREEAELEERDPEAEAESIAAAYAEFDKLTNAERIRRGLPLKAPHKERTFWWPKPDNGGGNTCLYTTTKVVTSKTTTTYTPTVTSFTTKCMKTSTAWIPNTSTITKTRYDCTTITGTNTQTKTYCPTTTVKTTVTRCLF